MFSGKNFAKETTNIEKIGPNPKSHLVVDKVNNSDGLNVKKEADLAITKPEADVHVSSPFESNPRVPEKENLPATLPEQIKKSNDNNSLLVDRLNEASKKLVLPSVIFHNSASDFSKKGLTVDDEVNLLNEKNQPEDYEVQQNKEVDVDKASGKNVSDHKELENKEDKNDETRKNIGDPQSNEQVVNEKPDIPPHDQEGDEEENFDDRQNADLETGRLDTYP